MTAVGSRPVIGVVADDFTGASDISGILAREGARTLQVVGVPGSVPAGFDAVVASLKTRSVAAPDAVRLTLDACAALRAGGAGQIVFKVCSTFDSTLEGNIGPVATALLDALQAPLAIVCPAMPANGRTVYQGHLFVQDRLLSESGMERHPLTPMTDPDIRRWLARQTPVPVGHLPLAALRAGQGAEGLARAEARGERLVVADAITDDDLRALGALARGHALVVGGSGLALGLPATHGLAARPGSADLAVRGPGLVLAGSCSVATLAQVATHAEKHPSLRIGEEAVTAPERTRDAALAFLARHRHDEPLVHSTDAPEAVVALQARHGAGRVAAAFEGLFAALAREAVAAGVTRLVVAGGETSGAVVESLGLVSFEVGAEIAPGVPVLRSMGPVSLALALKSGNFGGPGFFANALAALGERG